MNSRGSASRAGALSPSVSRVNSKSHIPTMTPPQYRSQTPVLHLKAYLTFHSSIHRLRTLRRWARPRLAFGRQCSELKATHGPSLVLWVTKHTSRARNSWPVFLTHKEKPGIWRGVYADGFRFEPGQTKALKGRTRQMVFFFFFRVTKLVSEVPAKVEENWRGAGKKLTLLTEWYVWHIYHDPLVLLVFWIEDEN